MFINSFYQFNFNKETKTIMPQKKLFLFLIIFYSLTNISYSARHKSCNRPTTPFPVQDSEEEDSSNEPNEIEDDNADEENAEAIPEYEKIANFVGTNLFGDGFSSNSKICLPHEKIALLRVREEFEYLLPKDLPKTLTDDKLVVAMMHYFYGANQVILRMCNGVPKIVAEKAFYDALGGYLHWYLLPVMKTSFYAGLICLKTAQNVIELYKQCKLNLNTNGNLWRPPLIDFTEFEIRIEPIQIFMHADKDETSCVHLDISDEKSEIEEDMIVSLPKLDAEENGLLTNIWLPFKRKKTFNLRSVYSAFIFLKYFETVSRCYKFQGICQKGYNNRLKDWLQENIESHLDDDILYPGLGAISRVLETVKHDRDIVLKAESEEDKKAKRQYVSDEGLSKRQKTPEYSKIATKAKKLESKKHGYDFIDELFRSKHTLPDKINNEEYHEIKNETKKQSEQTSSINIPMIMLLGGIAISSSAFIALLIMMVASKKSPQMDIEQSKKSNWCGCCCKGEEDDLKPLVKAPSSTHSSKKELTKGKKPVERKSLPYTGQERQHKG